jgi:glycosyltransferase involved in cell wall biosynthesis
MNHIYFVGDMKSPFISQDADLLKELYPVTIFDTSHLFSFRQLPHYMKEVLFQWRNILDSTILWIWFADYPALPFILLAKLFRKPVIINVGGWEVYNAPEINYGNQRNLIRGAVTRWILNNCKMIITPSNAYKKIIDDLLKQNPSRVHVIPNFIDTSLCDEPLPKKQNTIITAICTSSTNLLKGIPTFNEVAKISHYKMVVIKNVPHDELLKIFKESKIYCQLSYTESFGISLVEAMACGCVPVVTDRDALPEIIGTTGIVVPYGDVITTRNAIDIAMLYGEQPPRDQARAFTKGRKKLRIQALVGDLCN